MSYTTYITSWGRNPTDIVNEMISKNVLKPNTRLVLAFASFNFTSTDYIPGLNNLSMDDVKNLVNLVHQNNAKISLSVGGATYPFAGSDLYSRPGDLASNINTVLNNCGFDGVDFDIEDSAWSVPSDFANNSASLINTLRSLNPNLYLTLTTAAQAWAAGTYQQTLINYTIGNLDAWQPMEYDLWIASGSTYYDQVVYDLEFYMNTWGVSPSKMILGLMPGLDDMGRNLTLQDAFNLTTYAMEKNLKGVMTWDIDIDSEGADGNAPYAYSLGIQNILQNDVPTQWLDRVLQTKLNKYRPQMN